MVNLEALANELRAAAEGFVLRDPDDALVVCSGSGDRLLIVEESGRCVLGGDVYELDDAIRLAPLLAIIARHLGAGQPVAADRAALVDMFIGALSRYGLLAGDEQLRPEVADTLIAVVEAAGWGPRAEPVAPPEPLSADEVAAMAGKLMANRVITYSEIVRSVLAALPARHAVPVEGA